jgi:hypothetical protein
MTTLNTRRRTFGGRTYLAIRRCRCVSDAIKAARESGPGHSWTHLPGEGFWLLREIDPMTGLPVETTGAGNSDSREHGEETAGLLATDHGPRS